MDANGQKLDLVSKYDEILGGRYLSASTGANGRHSRPRSAASSAHNTPEQAQGTETGENGVPGLDEDNDFHKTNFKSDLKKVVEFEDAEGQKHVIGLETYKFKASRSRQTRGLGGDEDKPFKDYAVLLKAVVSDDVRGGTKADFCIEIQSDGLKEIFRRIARGYRELTLDNETIVIEYPFRSLFFLRGKIKDLSTAPETPPHTRRELVSLLDFINSPVGHQKIIEAYNELVLQGKITFRMLWTLYPPYEPVLGQWYDKIDDAPCYLVESVTFMTDEAKGGEPYWSVVLLHGYHDEDTYQVRSETMYITWFDGTKDIDSSHLDYFPVNLFSEDKQKEIRSQLIERGKLYVEYSKRDFSFMHYTGNCYLDSDESKKRLKEYGSSQWMSVDGRVMIDRTAERQAIDDTVGILQAYSVRDYLAAHSEKAHTEEVKATANVRQRLQALVEGTAEASTSTNDEPGWMLGPDLFKGTGDVELTDDDYMICRSNMSGFVLGQKIWVTHIYVNSLREIKWEADPFQQLQLSSQKKMLVHRLVKGFQGKADDFDDLISGKGQGLIFLLHGAPGLGKTLTAESVAESTRRPLYHVSTGELSIDVQDLEKQLTTIFQLGARWNAVVLLDEADVLMSARTVHDLQRNSIVAVFLRLLEYYRGMLFLTTNRHSDFDDAFYNRIHITIQYGSLTASWRTNIWRDHLARATRRNRESHWWTEEMYALLGEIMTNGRDIKNFVRTSLAFAQAEDEDVTLVQLMIVLENNLTEDALLAQKETFDKLRALREGLPAPKPVEKEGEEEDDSKDDEKEVRNDEGDLGKSGSDGADSGP